LLWCEGGFGFGEEARHGALGGAGLAAQLGAGEDTVLEAAAASAGEGGEVVGGFADGEEPEGAPDTRAGYLISFSRSVVCPLSKSSFC
jgi:hypothetical protein